MLKERYCERCEEPIPPYSRICPSCCSGDYFSIFARKHETPVFYLEMMRGYIDEMLAIPKLTTKQKICELLKSGHRDPRRNEIREIKESFEVVAMVVELHFAEHNEVLNAVEMMKDILSEQIKSRGLQLDDY